MSNHDAIRKNIKTGDILLSRKINDPISKLIQGVTKSNWSHSFIYIGDNKVIESDWIGIVIHPLDKYLNNKYHVGLFRVSPPLSEEDQTKIVTEIRKLLGIKYGYFQLIWAAILRFFGKDDDPDWSLDIDPGMICSEAVGRAYKSIGITFKNLPPEQLEPVDFEESEKTVRIV